MTMRKFLTAMIFSLACAGEALACVPEDPTHNAYMFSVFRRERMSSPFAEDMNNWWKRYGGQPESSDDDYYESNRDSLKALARRRGDSQMLDYMHWLDEFLRVSNDISMETWNYPTRSELDSRDSVLHLMLSHARAYRGRKMRPQYALLTMRANMLLGRDKANMLYWTSTASKLPDGVYRDVCRNIYARALLGAGLTRQACDIYAEQGDMRSIKWCMRNYRSLAGIKSVYADDPNAGSLLFLVQDFVNNVQETIDTAPEDSFALEWIKIKGAYPVMTADAAAFVTFADKVLAEGKTDNPCLWQSAAAMIEYLSGHEAEAARRADEAVGMKGTARMKDNARCIRLLTMAATCPLGGEMSERLADEFRWLDGKIEEERGNSPAYANHYTDVKERVAYRVLAVRYRAAELNKVALALYGMMEENRLAFDTGGRHSDKSFVWDGDWPWNKDYAAYNEYFAQISTQPADSVAAYYAYLTSAKTDVFEHYVALQVYQNSDYYNDLIGTRYLAEGRFAEARNYLERVSLDYLPKQNISWYMTNRRYDVPRWFTRQLPNVPETDGPGQGTPDENLKVKYCKDMLQLQGRYSLAPAGGQREALAYELAVRSYQASCYGDCWFLTHYARSVTDSARVGELDFAARTSQYLAECRNAADLSLQYSALYALAYVDTDPWFSASYDENYNLVTVPRPASSQYKALEALSRFISENPQAADEHATKCDVLRMFR